MQNNNVKPVVKRVVLAYSGGLDTSIIIPWCHAHVNMTVNAHAIMTVGQVVTHSF